MELLSGRELRILTVTWEDAPSTEGAAAALAPCRAPISEEA